MEKHWAQGPRDGPKWREDARQSAQALASARARFATALDDARCVVRRLELGRNDRPTPLRDVLRSTAVPCEAVRSAWLVPTAAVLPLLPDLASSCPWAAAASHASLAPYLKLDQWLQYEEEARSGHGDMWERVQRQTDHVLLLKVETPLMRLPWLLWRRVPSLGAVAVAARRARPREVAVWLWPLRWELLAAWVVFALLREGLRARIDQLQVDAALVREDSSATRESISLYFMHAAILVYAARSRHSVLAAMREAKLYNEAGTAALRGGRLDTAERLFGDGAASAAKLGPRTWLNGTAHRQAEALEGACLNNRALVRLRREDWRGTAEDATHVCALPGVNDVVRAKALYRKAAALYRIGQGQQAASDLLEAQQLMPGNGEIRAMLRLVRHGEDWRSRSRRGGPDTDVDSGSGGCRVDLVDL